MNGKPITSPISTRGRAKARNLPGWNPSLKIDGRRVPANIMMPSAAEVKEILLFDTINEDQNIAHLMEHCLAAHIHINNPKAHSSGGFHAGTNPKGMYLIFEKEDFVKFDTFPDLAPFIDHQKKRLYLESIESILVGSKIVEIYVRQNCLTYKEVLDRFDKFLKLDTAAIIKSFKKIYATKIKISSISQTLNFKPITTSQKQVHSIKVPKFQPLLDIFEISIMLPMTLESLAYCEAIKLLASMNFSPILAQKTLLHTNSGGASMSVNSLFITYSYKTLKGDGENTKNVFWDLIKNARHLDIYVSIWKERESEKARKTWEENILRREHIFSLLRFGHILTEKEIKEVDSQKIVKLHHEVISNPNRFVIELTDF